MDEGDEKPKESWSRFEPYNGREDVLGKEVVEGVGETRATELMNVLRDSGREGPALSRAIKDKVVLNDGLGFEVSFSVVAAGDLNDSEESKRRRELTSQERVGDGCRWMSGSEGRTEGSWTHKRMVFVVLDDVPGALMGADELKGIAEILGGLVRGALEDGRERGSQVGASEDAGV